jgi:hypothetical protein
VEDPRTRSLAPPPPQRLADHGGRSSSSRRHRRSRRAPGKLLSETTTGRETAAAVHARRRPSSVPAPPPPIRLPTTAWSISFHRPVGWLASARVPLHVPQAAAGAKKETGLLCVYISDESKTVGHWSRIWRGASKCVQNTAWHNGVRTEAVTSS